ncbi:type II toxin-antitoxin system YafQ family toxin [Butyrivibrio proteoclasticus]|uniref:type II toxin-antitoxin system YafQ family toxin n=1 Tax=Butyrivibrio proteoclasticus TaxID=43305 RepID=UPI0009DF1FDB|nr:type II toxin-antitoxin system YafQ family toxin [Butyrivibrio proteoclasticus]
MVSEIIRSTQFKKDYKLAIKRGCKEEDFKEVFTCLAEQKPLPDKYHDHSLNDSKHYAR